MSICGKTAFAIAFPSTFTLTARDCASLVRALGRAAGGHRQIIQAVGERAADGHRRAENHAVELAEHRRNVVHRRLRRRQGHAFLFSDAVANARAQIFSNRLRIARRSVTPGFKAVAHTVQRGLRRLGALLEQLLLLLD